MNTTHLADRIACFAGDMRFFALNAGAMTAWIAWNTFAPWRFDAYPFQMLTLVLSIEAIFLTIFVLISQNRQAEQDRKMEQRDCAINEQAEKEIRVLIAHVQRMELRLEQIQIRR